MESINLLILKAFSSYFKREQKNVWYKMLTITQKDPLITLMGIL